MKSLFLVSLMFLAGCTTCAPKDPALNDILCQAPQDATAEEIILCALDAVKVCQSKDFPGNFVALKTQKYECDGMQCTWFSFYCIDQIPFKGF